MVLLQRRELRLLLQQLRAERRTLLREPPRLLRRARDLLGLLPYGLLRVLCCFRSLMSQPIEPASLFLELVVQRRLLSD